MYIKLKLKITEILFIKQNMAKSTVKMSTFIARSYVFLKSN